jgi:hypothetical protein
MLRRAIATLLGATALFCNTAFAADVGFQEIKISNAPQAPLAVGIWYPTRSDAADAAPMTPDTPADVNLR